MVFLFIHNAKSQRTTIEFVLVAVTCAALVFATYFTNFQSSSEGVHTVSRLLRQFNLAQENNFAAWYSGALLALIALHALDGDRLYRATHPRLARAWIMIAVVFLFLSADEIGSLHERLSLLSISLGFGAWGLLLALGALLGVIIAFAVFSLWRTGGVHRRNAYLLICGFAIFGSVAFQEFLEHALTWNSAHIKALRVTIEEGSELLGMLVLLKVAMSLSVELLENGVSGEQGSVFAVLFERRTVLIISLAILTPIVIFLTLAVPSDDRGMSADWLAAMAFLAAASVVASSWLRKDAGHASTFIVALLLAVSCSCIAISSAGLTGIAGAMISRKAVLIIVLCLVAIGIGHFLKLAKVTVPYMLAVIVLSLGLFVLRGNPASEFALTISLGTVVYHLFSRATRRQRSLEN